MTSDGFTLIEIILALALTALVVTGVTGGLLLTDRSLSGLTDSVTARLMTGECMAVVRWMRDDSGFDALMPGTHGLGTGAEGWQLLDAPDVSDGFTRTVTISDAGPTLKDIECVVEWEQDGRPASVSLSTSLSL